MAEDSAGAVYEEAVPTVPSGSAGSSGAGGVGAGGQSADGSGSSGSGGSATDGSSSDDDKSGGAAAGKGGGNGQGSQAGGAANRSGVGGGHALTRPGTPAISHESGSSPLVPILIALAVLAAISIGVVTMRRRNQDGGGPGATSGSSRISPEAG